MRLQVFPSFHFNDQHCKCRLTIVNMNTGLFEYTLEGSPASWVGKVRNPHLAQQVEEETFAHYISKGDITKYEPGPVWHRSKSYYVEVSTEYLLTHSNNKIRLLAKKEFLKELSDESSSAD